MRVPSCTASFVSSASARVGSILRRAASSATVTPLRVLFATPSAAASHARSSASAASACELFERLRARIASSVGVTAKARKKSFHASAAGHAASATSVKNAAMNPKAHTEARALFARSSDARASRRGLVAASPPRPWGIRGPPHTPQTQCSFGPLPLGSTRAIAPQCGHAFPAPLVKPHEEHAPSTTVARPHAEQLDGGGLITEPANYPIGTRMRAFARRQAKPRLLPTA